ncbi:aldo/keto reductase [Dongia deserti]|uniref:aldo/keto reductase n=1 Tax=Dongia deserti TaxID=2268030 RepID=UPI000E64CDEE|nr:aldo/keto reductase [Dongia deserti]
MRQVALRNGARVSAVGLGTWKMGEDVRQRAQEVRALATGIDLGATLIDTAEMYADGRAEEVVAAAIKGRRDGVYLVSKVLPQNASRAGTVKACEASLKRLKTDRIDLYLLHWRGSVPFAETMAGFDDLIQSGKILSFGVSNLDLNEMQEWVKLSRGDKTLVDQVQYSIDTRGIDFDLVPWCLDHKIAVMAYCPLSQGTIPRNATLKRIAERHGATPAQIMLAWVLRHEHVIAIPKSAKPERVRENVQAADVLLSAEDLMDLDKEFPPPRKAQPLAMT